MRIRLVGHLCVDRNVVHGSEETLYGGGVMHGSLWAKRLGAEVELFTKCAEVDRPHFAFLEAAGIDVHFLQTERSTSIQNVYPTDNPDDRESRMLSRAAPFTAEDLPSAAGDVLHVNPLWLGEFPPELLLVARERTRLLAADAQGFLRAVDEDGRMAHRPWAERQRYLPLLDLLKVDIKEARVLSGLGEPREAAERIRELGPKAVLCTHQGGVCVCDETGTYEAPFTGFSLRGRTGRGDTCTAAFLVGRERMSTADATVFAARITSEKMQRG